MIHDNTLKRRLGAIAFILTRRGTLRAMFQAMWLAVGVVAVGIGLHIWQGWPLTLGRFAQVGAGIALLYVLIDLFLNRVNPYRLAHRLDERLGLHEQTVTALDVASHTTEPTYVEGLLIERAGETLTQAEKRVKRMGWMPWRELETLLATLLITVGLYFLTGLGGGLPTVSPRPLPGLPNAAPKTVQAPRTQGVPVPQPVTVPGPGLGESMQRALDALAEALGDQAATAAVAEALRQGDTGRAADEMRRLADQINSLSQQGRRDVAQALQRGAQATRPDAPQLSDQLRRSASAVERGGTGAQRSLEDLARELDNLGQGQGQGQQAQQGQPGQGQGQGQGQPQSPGQQGQQGQQGQPGQGGGQGQGQGAGQGAGQQREGDDDRLGAEGVPVELAAQPDPSEPTSRRADPNAVPKGQASGAQFGQGGAPAGGAVEAASDPLRYPWELRGVVQEYFTPSR